jgi:hypothetical protein
MECCPSADRQTATCGSCCSAEDCNDSVGCTKDQCGGGQCSHTPRPSDDPLGCPADYYCDLDKGECQKSPDCERAADCTPTACQTNPQCDGGTCKFGGCSNGTKCCQNGCAICCSAAECSDQIACTKDTCGPNGCAHTPDNSLCLQGQFCDPQLGCVGCRNAGDCNDDKPCTVDECVMGNVCAHTVKDCGKAQYCTANGCVDCIADSDCQIYSGPGTQALPSECVTNVCSGGKCVEKALDCGEQMCCPPYGCALHCGIIIEPI